MAKDDDKTKVLEVAPPVSEDELKILQENLKKQRSIDKIKDRIEAVKGRVNSLVNDRIVREGDEARRGFPKLNLQPSNTEGLPLMDMGDIGDEVKDIDLGDYRKQKVLGNIAEAAEARGASKFSKLAEVLPFKQALKGAAKTGLKAAAHVAVPLGAMMDLADIPEANAGADQIPGRQSFDELHGPRETPEQKAARIAAMNRFLQK